MDKSDIRLKDHKMRQNEFGDWIDAESDIPVINRKPSKRNVYDKLNEKDKSE